MIPLLQLLKVARISNNNWIKDLRPGNTVRAPYFVCSLCALNFLSHIYLLANSCSMRSLLKDVAQINTCEQGYVWKSLPLPSPPSGYLQWLEQFFHQLMPAHVSFTHVLMRLKYVQNLKERIYAAFFSKDDPEKKSFGAISLGNNIFRWISTARCCVYILY